MACRRTGEQILIAESLAKELMAGHSSNAYEYKMSNADLVHVYYLPHTESIRDFQWVTTTIRSITELRWAFTYNVGRAFVVRGTPSQMEPSEWLVQKLDQRDGSVGQSECRGRGAADDVLHVYFVKNVESAESLDELASMIRSVGNIRRLHTVVKPLAVAMRGTAEQMALADWLLQKLDQPTSGSTIAEQDLNGTAGEFQVHSSGDAVRVFYLRNETVGAFQNVASEMRTAAGGPKVFGALAVRGTADQIAATRNLINERFKKTQR